MEHTCIQTIKTHSWGNRFWASVFTFKNAIIQEGHIKSLFEEKTYMPVIILVVTRFTLNLCISSKNTSHKSGKASKHNLRIKAIIKMSQVLTVTSSPTPPPPFVPGTPHPHPTPTLWAVILFAYISFFLRTSPPAVRVF